MTCLEEISARVEVAKKPEVLAAKHTTRRGYRNAKDMKWLEGKWLELLDLNDDSFDD